MLKFLYNKLAPEAIRLMLLPYAKQISNIRTLMRDYGQFGSLKLQNCVDAAGNEIPWYTYPSIEYLDQFNFSQLKILEFGSGNSTIWWKKRCGELTSIESDESWYRKIVESDIVDHGASYVLSQDQKEYVERREIFDSDVIIIDGKWRPECAVYLSKHADHLRKNVGMIIFDNSDWYQNSLKYLNANINWVQVDFMGFGPINGYCWSTSILINPEIQIPRRAGIEPIRRRQHEPDIIPENKDI